MPKRKLNLTLEPGIYDYAVQIQAARRFPNLVALVEQLLREEWERRNGPVMIHEESHKGKTATEDETRIHSPQFKYPPGKPSHMSTADIDNPAAPPTKLSPDVTAKIVKATEGPATLNDPTYLAQSPGEQAADKVAAQEIALENQRAARKRRSKSK